MVLVPITDERGEEVWVSSRRVRVEQLRAELARRGLNTSGRKPELADRLNSVHADIEDMQVVQTTDQQEISSSNRARPSSCSSRRGGDSRPLTTVAAAERSAPAGGVW